MIGRIYVSEGLQTWSMCHLITSLGNSSQFQQKNRRNGQEENTKCVCDEKDTSAKKVQKIESEQRERENREEKGRFSEA